MTQDAGPLFSSSVHPQQTSSDQASLEPTKKLPSWAEGLEIDHSPTPYDYYVPEPSARETDFRHSGWKAARERVIAALRAARVSAGRVERFVKCGADCHVEVSEDGKMFRCNAHYCGDRFCVPCATARAARVRKELHRIIGDQPVRFLTLTRRDDGSTLDESLRHLRESFSRLREQSIWIENVRASVYAIEITRGRSGAGWHVHAHVLAMGRWVDQRDWVAAWKVASGGSIIVDIRKTDSSTQGINYVLKYATKGFDQSVLKNQESIVEAMIALRGKRLIGATGEWYNADLKGDYEPKISWKRVDRLDAIVYAAERREKWAIGILQALRRRVFSEHEPTRQAGGDLERDRPGGPA